MSQSVETLLEERLLQLQQISERRTSLLQEMYHLIHKRENFGSSLSFELKDGEQMQSFLDRFDLEKHPETGHISNMPVSELLGDELDTEMSESVDTSPPSVKIESPITEPPTPPERLSQDILPLPEEMDTGEMEVVETQQTGESGAEEPASDDVLLLKSTPQVGMKRKRSPSDDDESPDELDLLATSRATSRHVSSLSRSRSRTTASRLPSEIPYGSPLPQIEPQLSSPQIESELIADDLVEYEVTKEEPTDEELDVSEDDVSHILQPSASSATDTIFPSVTLPSRARPVYVMSAPEPSAPLEFIFDGLEEPDESMAVDKPASPAIPSHLTPEYTLPPLKLLPLEFNRKSKSSRQRKRDKEKEKNGDRGDYRRDDWAPLGYNRWGAAVRANPIWVKLAKATKCITTNDWNVGITELRFLRTVERVEKLKEDNAWSFRQPKKQRGVGYLSKSHWDYLMDEMKWMRIDFREERRWKVALAFGLAQSVMAWHEAGTLEERVRRGICVLWKRPQPEQDDTAADRADQDAVEIPDMDDETGPDSRDTNTPANDYGSDDDSDDEQEKEQEQDRRDVFDALAPGTLLAEALADKEAKVDGSGSDHVQFKTEDVEDTSGLRNTLDERADAMDVDSKPAIEDNVERDSGTKALENEDPTATALKDSSSDPVLTHHSTDTQASHSSGKARSKAKSTAYAPLREEIIYSAVDKLFIDCDELDLAKGMSELSTDDYLQSLPPPPDLTSIFPDLTPFGLPEPVTSGPSPSGGNEGRRKSDKRTDKDDPNRRVEETAYNKLYPMSDFMHTKPTLLGALHPSKHWHDGEWDNVEDAVIATEFDSPSPRVIEESSCSLFDGNKSNSPGLPILLLPGIRKDPRSSKRAPEPVWNPTDDAILKCLVEKYPGNWILIADAFNSSRVTISTDRRSPAECYERWLELSGRSSEAHSQDDARSHPAAPATPMTTRGTKRTAAMASSATPVSTTATNVTVESKRKRRHALLYEAMRKAMKKREANLKANAAQRKPATIVHDTHGQYSKLPKMTPLELSRVKHEREQDAKRRIDMEHRQQRSQLIQQQSQLVQAQQPQQPQQLPQAQAAQVQNGPRPPNPNHVAQIRSQVGISQQQRASATQLSMANARAMLTAQGVQPSPQTAQAQAQAQQAQAHAQAGPSSAMAAIPAVSTHLSPPYAARATTSSPAIPQQSPPLQPSAASNVPGSRPPSTQPHAGMAQGQAGHINIPHTAAANLAYYQVPQHLRTAAQLTPEQIHNLLRNATANNLNPQNGSYSQS